MRFRALISTALLATYLPACMGYAKTQQPLAELLAAPEPPGELRVTTESGSEYEFKGPRLVADTLVGQGKSLTTNLPVSQVPADQVRTVKVKKFSVGKTAALILGIAAVGAVFGVVMNNAWDDAWSGASIY